MSEKIETQELIELELGQIIKIISPKNENYHNKIYIIDYLDENLMKITDESKEQTSLKINEGKLNMGIHYDYKSTRGDKAMKKEAKRKARIEQRRAKRSVNNSKESEEKLMHDIDKPITLEDLTNPDKN